LCHKFCSVRIECHHIVQPKDGGQDTFENCIPLCFDCHAEVGHYNEAHPKGTKFTAKELREHRDRWFKKVESGISEGAPSDHLDLDKNLFQKLLNTLGGSQKMTHFRDHDYGGYYPVAVDQRLDAFQHTVDLPETEFFDLEMESAFADLKRAIAEYEECHFGKVWHNPNGLAGVPREWRDGDAESRQRFREAAKLMNASATVVWDSYCQFIKMGRVRLKIEMHVQERS
jgi:hypothetical protein